MCVCWPWINRSAVQVLPCKFSTPPSIWNQFGGKSPVLKAFIETHETRHPYRHWVMARRRNKFFTDIPCSPPGLQERQEFSRWWCIHRSWQRSTMFPEKSNSEFWIFSLEDFIDHQIIIQHQLYTLDRACWKLTNHKITLHHIRRRLDIIRITLNLT